MISTRREIKGKHVLVVGGAGFIGSHLVDHLIMEEVGQLTVIDNFFLGNRANLSEAQQKMPGMRILSLDVSSDNELNSALARLEPVDVVFDLAVIPLPTSLERPKFCFDTNVRITSVLCELLITRLTH